MNRVEDLSNTTAGLTTVTILSGGVGGARLARGFARLHEVDSTVVVNVGDDSVTHSLNVSPDLDTVLYTLAGIEGPQGWGRGDDTFRANEELSRFGVDTTFKLGDLDLALKLFRSDRLAAGERLSVITAAATAAFGVTSTILPATDQTLRTEIGLHDGSWLSFQEYFVHRKHADEVARLRFEGSDAAQPAPGVIEAIEGAATLVIAPSNPPLSIWPILSIESIRAAVEDHANTIAVSPLIGGRAVKGPADRVLRSLGLPPGNAGVAGAYAGLINRIVIDRVDRDDAAGLAPIEVQLEDTLIAEPARAERLARAILSP